MKTLIVLALTLLSHSVLASQCTKEVAFKKAIDKIKAQFPSLYEEKKPYETLSEKDRWVILGFTPPTMRGGGAPEVSVDKETCEVGRVYLAR